MTASDLLTVLLDFDGAEENVTEFMQGGSIRRGRSQMTGAFNPGRLTLPLRTEGGEFIPPFPGADPGAFGIIHPGQAVRVFCGDPDDAGVQIYGGNVDDWDPNWENKGAPVNTLTALDALSILAGRKTSGWQTTPGQRIGARLTAMLARPEVDWSGATSFDTGVMNLQGDLVAAATNCRDYARLLERTDGGRFFASRTNALVYKQVNLAAIPSPALTFVDTAPSPGEARIFGLQLAYGSDEWYTQVNVTRAGGVKQTASSTSDITDLHAGGFRPFDLDGLLLTFDGASMNLAQYWLALLEQLVTTVSGLRIEMDALPEDLVPIVAALDIGDRVETTWTPITDEVTQLLAIEGIEDTWSQRSPWVRLLRLSKAVGLQSWVIGDNPLGTIGSGVLGL